MPDSTVVHYPPPPYPVPVLLSPPRSHRTTRRQVKTFGRMDVGVHGDALRLVSWNVAGWNTALAHVRKRHGSLASFMEQHKIDILCVQETKLVTSVLEFDFNKYSAREPGIETVWACNDGKGQQRRGLNGVATFCREGLLRGADAAPLRVEELDTEGRCIMTDHGGFLVFNVYIPASHSLPRLPYKVRYLRGLRAAMDRERVARGKPVILAGDLNLAPHPEDRHWKHRFVSARTGLRALSAVSCGEEVFFERRGSEDVYSAAVVRALERRELTTDELSITCDDEKFVMKAKDTLTPYDLLSVAKAVRSSDVGTGALNALQALSEAEGASTTPDTVCSWYNELAGPDGKMVDSYHYLRTQSPHRESPQLANGERFTCWDQTKNRRYSNEGSRIDYLLADRAFFEKHCAPYLSHPAALHKLCEAAVDCTAGGRFAPATGTTSGIPEAPADAYMEQFSFTLSPFVYTPPEYSDHIAVSMWIGPRSVLVPSPLEKNKSVARCQPFKKQRSIASFFAPQKAHARPAHGRPASVAPGRETPEGERSAKKPRLDGDVIDLG